MNDKDVSKQIDNIIKLHGGWKGALLSQLREVILDSSDDIVEEIKWKTPSRPEGLPVWSCNGIVCFAEIWKDNVKLLFPKGAYIQENTHLFNARLKSSTIRAIEFREQTLLDQSALKELVQEAVLYNRA